MCVDVTRHLYQRKVVNIYIMFGMLNTINYSIFCAFLILHINGIGQAGIIAIIINTTILLIVSNADINSQYGIAKIVPHIYIRY